MYTKEVLVLEKEDVKKLIDAIDFESLDIDRIKQSFSKERVINENYYEVDVTAHVEVEYFEPTDKCLFCIKVQFEFLAFEAGEEIEIDLKKVEDYIDERQDSAIKDINETYYYC